MQRFTIVLDIETGTDCIGPDIRAVAAQVLPGFKARVQDAKLIIPVGVSTAESVGRQRSPELAGKAVQQKQACFVIFDQSKGPSPMFHSPSKTDQRSRPLDQKK